MDAEELLENCEKMIKWFNVMFIWYSFIGKFRPKEITKICSEAMSLNESEIETFIKICDGRIGRLKSFSRDIMALLGLSISSIAIVASILAGSSILAGTEEQFSLCDVWSKTGLVFQTFTVIIIIIAVGLFFLILQCRAKSHAWYAIKEKILLTKKYS